jgi:hypothetical protein
VLHFFTLQLSSEGIIHCLQLLYGDTRSGQTKTSLNLINNNIIYFSMAILKVGKGKRPSLTITLYTSLWRY